MQQHCEPVEECSVLVEPTFNTLPKETKILNNEIIEKKRNPFILFTNKTYKKKRYRDREGGEIRVWRRVKLERSEGLGTENGILVLAVVAVLKIGRRKEDLAAIVAAIFSFFSLNWNPGKPL